MDLALRKQLGKLNQRVYKEYGKKKAIRCPLRLLCKLVLLLA